MEYKGDFGSEGSSHVPTDVTWSWKEIGGEMCRVMLGNTPALPRTCNIAHVLGNVTVSELLHLEMMVDYFSVSTCSNI